MIYFSTLEDLNAYLDKHSTYKRRGGILFSDLSYIRDTKRDVYVVFFSQKDIDRFKQGDIFGNFVIGGF